MTLDRVDGSKDYSKENCRWATPTEQTINQGVREDNKSGVKGVFELTKKGVIIAAWSISPNKQQTKSFSISKYGYTTAFKLACEHRLKMEEKYYK